MGPTFNFKMGPTFNFKIDFNRVTKQDVSRLNFFAFTRVKGSAKFTADQGIGAARLTKVPPMPFGFAIKDAPDVRPGRLIRAAGVQRRDIVRTPSKKTAVTSLPLRSVKFSVSRA